jgi:hypothetical protein
MLWVIDKHDISYISQSKRTIKVTCLFLVNRQKSRRSITFSGIWVLNHIIKAHACWNLGQIHICQCDARIACTVLPFVTPITLYCLLSWSNYLITTYTTFTFHDKWIMLSLKVLSIKVTCLYFGKPEVNRAKLSCIFSLREN